MLDGLLGTLASGALAAAGAWAFRRYSQRAPEVSATATTLRHGPALGVLGGLVVAIVGGAAVAVLGDGPRLPTAVLWVFGVLMALGLTFGGWLLASYALARVVVRADGVASRDGLGREAEVAWGAVERVRFGRLSGTLRLTGRDGQTVRIPALMHGADAVVDLLERHGRAEGLALAAERFRKAHRASVG